MPSPQYRRDVWDPLRSGAAIQVGGRKFVVRGKADFAVRGFFLELADAVSKNQAGEAPPLRLLALRPELRKILRDAPLAGLVSCLSLSNEPVVQRLVLWLLGHCHSQRAIPAVALFREAADDGVCKQAVRALYHLGAWAELRSISPAANPQLQRYLMAPRRRPFAERMAQFAESAAPEKSAPAGLRRSRMATFWAVLPGRGRPPKSADYIRLILERIRALLHGPMRDENRMTRGK